MINRQTVRTGSVMLKRFVIVITAVVGLALCLGCEQGDPRVSLRFKYEPGMNLSYQQIMKRTIRVTEGDSTIRDMTDEVTMAIEQHVRRIVNDSTAEIHERNSWEYVEPSKEDSTVMDTVERNREYVIFAQPSGRISEIDFVTETEASSREYMKDFYEQALPRFPAGEHGRGYTWTQQTTVSVEGEEMTASSTYEIMSFVRESGYDCVVISFKGDLILPIQANPEDSTQRHGVDHMRATGKIYFAYKEGFVVLERDRWVVDGDRKLLRNDDWIQQKLAIQFDIDYALKQVRPS